MSEIDRQWQFLLHEHSDQAIQALAARASREPALRRLFPYASLQNLRFSKATQYPYDPMPYIETLVPGELYRARAADHTPLCEGALDEVVSEIARLVSMFPEQSRAK